MKKLFPQTYFGLRLLILFPFLLNTSSSIAQIEIDEEPKRLYYERLRRVERPRDMKDFRDVFHKDKLLMGKNRISGNISYNTGRIIINDGRENRDEWRSAMGFYTRIRFFEQFSINTTFYHDFNQRAAARWTSNFTYSIGRY